MHRLTLRVICLVAVLAGMLAFTSSASAAVRPYFASGTAHFVSLTDFVGSGRATHLGPYTEEGNVAFAPTSIPGVLQVTGTNSYFAANGDRLDAEVSGTLNQDTGAIQATITYVGGCGRFEDACGQSTLAGQIQLDGTIHVTVVGVIDY